MVNQPIASPVFFLRPLYLVSTLAFSQQGLEAFHLLVLPQDNRHDLGSQTAMGERP
jgi:hypothetical protein